MQAQANIGKEVASKVINFINTGSTLGAVNLPEMQLPFAKDSHRILNFHRNVPGVLRDINQLLAGYNVRYVAALGCAVLRYAVLCCVCSCLAVL